MKYIGRNLINHIIYIFDNPITKALAFSLWAIPLYIYLNSLTSTLVLSASDYDNFKQFIEWFGIPFGMLIVLLLVNVWTHFNAIEEAFDREADAILAFYNSIILITNPSIKKKLKVYVFNYIKFVINSFASEFTDIQMKRKGDNILNDIMQIVVTNAHKKKGDSLSIELLRLHNDWVSERRHRLSISLQRMPKPVLMLLTVASILWLAPFFTLKFSNPLIGTLLIGGVTLLITSILLIVIDLDKPLGGTWGINLDSWDELLIEKIDEL